MAKKTKKKRLSRHSRTMKQFNKISVNQMIVLGENKAIKKLDITSGTHETRKHTYTHWCV